MGRKPKDAKKITLKFDRVIYERLVAFCDANDGMKITAAIECFVSRGLKRQKSKPKGPPDENRTKAPARPSKKTAVVANKR